MPKANSLVGKRVIISVMPAQASHDADAMASVTWPYHPETPYLSGSGRCDLLTPIYPSPLRDAVRHHRLTSVHPISRSSRRAVCEQATSTIRVILEPGVETTPRFCTLVQRASGAPGQASDVNFLTSGGDDEPGPCDAPGAVPHFEARTEWNEVRASSTSPFPAPQPIPTTLPQCRRDA